MPWGFWGVFFIALPLIARAIWLLAAVMRVAAAERRRYQAWKATLAPKQRAAVELAETAAMTAAIAMWQHHKRADARLSASIMGHAALNRVHAGIMGRLSARDGAQPVRAAAAPVGGHRPRDGTH